MAEQSTTAFLDKILKSNSLNDVAKIADEATDITFAEYFNQYLLKHPEYDIAKIIRESSVDRVYAYQIIDPSGKKKNPGRDRVIALCYAAHMTLDEVNHALLYSNNKTLYAKSKRDIPIIFAFKETGTRSVIKLNNALAEKGLEPLTTIKE